MATFEQTGTVTVTNGSRTVTGNGSAWLAGYDGTALNIAGAVYPVASIDSPNSLTLIEPYPGATASQLSYTLLPLKNENYDLSKKVQKIIDIAGELVDATVGPAGPAGEQGPQGPAGKSGDSGFGSIVNFSQYTPQPAGSPGVYMIVPVANGEPEGITLTQQAQVVIPYDKKNAGVGLWINSTTSGYAITLGLTNAPMPQPSVPKEDLNLSGAGEIFVSPGSIFPLNLSIGETNKTFTISVPGDVPIKKTIVNAGPVSRASDWTWDGERFRPRGNGVDTAATMPIEYDKDKIVWNGNRLVLNKAAAQNAALQSAALNTNFAITSDPLTNMIPAGVRFKIRCLIPAGQTGIMAMIGTYNVGEITLKYNWTDELLVSLQSGGSSGNVYGGKTTAAAVRRGTVQTYEVLWENNPSGIGGWVTFFVDGEQASDRIKTDYKPAISATSRLYIANSFGNNNDGIPDLEFESAGVTFTTIENANSYQAVSSGAITRDDLNALVVDATGITSNMTQRALTYSSNDGQTYSLGITIGEMSVPKYRAYKAVLEDWSSGAGVVHPNELVMTKPVAQNVRFEDTALYGAQPAWTEVVPQGACPNINGINYYCEGIRIGTYVQFQFLYDWDASQMPKNPFGNPTGKESYMVPHKWLIYDTEGTLLGRVEQPNGQPLNSASIKPVWEGQYDGNGVAIITNDNPHFNSGTVRSSVIWRSHDSEPYSKSDVWKRVPVFDQRVPFACFTGYSVNGGDMRIYDDNGQSNGFANWQAMSYEPTTYEEIQALARTAGAKLPYNLLYYSRGIVPNAGIFLKYAPFNQQGRSPITGPGGVRDDRQIMPEPVARYVLDMESKHPMTDVSMRKIALDYLTGYASDPFHALENGRPTPVYKDNQRRKVTLRNHYYGPGEMSIGESAAWYIQSGRVSEWARGNNPLRVQPSSGSAFDPKRPIFGTNSIDDAHSHQFPHWGSLLFKSPEFAFLGHKMSDQPRLYDNSILWSQWGPGNITYRGAAWKYAHAALCWKTASTGSTRLYSRAEMLDWVVFDFEQFYDTYYASTPGILNPPTNIFKDGSPDETLMILAGCARFGLANAGLSTNEGINTHDFFTGYWLSVLHTAERLGFNDAVRAASPKAKAVLDWLFAAHRKRIVGRTKNPLISSKFTYMTIYWTNEQIYASGGDVSKLPQTFEEVDMAQTKRPRTWDEIVDNDSSTGFGPRDGQACDQMLAGPALLKDMGMTGSDIDDCINIAEQRFQQKLAEEKARGAADAGSKWFLYHQATNNRPIKPTS